MATKTVKLQIRTSNNEYDLLYPETTVAAVNGLAAVLSAYQMTITGAAQTIDTENLTALRAVISSGDGKIAVSATTSAELAFVSGVTSSIQTQLNDRTTKTYIASRAQNLLTNGSA